MIRLGKHVRLTSQEVERFTLITGFVPEAVKSVEDLDAYVAYCKRYYWGTSEDTRFLHWLIDKERARCFRQS
jgi:hypothetical protein